ncbi:Transcriptional regulatory protein ZraR [Chromobacterium violaceum]|uniref:Transcriptional regulatory protein ZraR n=1 Tax=Chromobacterium violaceum TaxID=536 RepID=A0A3S4IBD4_CHRVL|nr:Transcriptional regulatory protein ZraR [Chromobacterium violaceum]
MAELPLAMQVKLLRAIQEKTVRKLGASQEEAVDARIICATHRDLAVRVESGQFRQDLYYRLNVLQLRMPPLRELRDDIPLFAERLLQRFGGASAPQLSADARRALQDYAYPAISASWRTSWSGRWRWPPGRAVARRPAADACAEHAPEPGSGEPLQDYLDRVEREAIVKALEGTRYNRTQAAKKLGSPSARCVTGWSGWA